MNNEFKKKFLLALKWFFYSFIWLGLILLAVDIITKNVVHHASGGNETWNVILIPNFLRISYVLNPNAAFGLGFDDPILNRVLYIIVAFIGLGIMIAVYVLRFKRIHKYVKACLSMMIVGAIGNLIDRLFYGFANYCVIDWIDFYGIWKWNFNIADSCIVVGTIMLIIWLIVAEIKDFRANKNRTKVTSPVLSKEEQRRENEAQEANNDNIES